MFHDSLELHRQGRLEEAARGYEAVLAADPTHVEALVHLGILHLNQHQPDEAEALLRRALARAPNSADALVNLGSALQALERGEEAVDCYRRAVALLPDAAYLKFALASCLQALGQHEEAIDAYGSLLAAEPAHAEANFGLATLLAGLGRTSEANINYRAALAADPDFAEASHGLGMVLMRERAYEDAAVCFGQALEVDPDYVDARLALCQALEQLDRDDEAATNYSAVLETEPDNVEARNGLGGILCRADRYAEAIEHYEAILATKPEHALTMARMGAALMRVDRHGEGLALCRKAVDLAPESAPALSMLSLGLTQIGEMEEGGQLSRRAVALAPRRVEFCYNLAQTTKIHRGDQVIDALEAMLPEAASLSWREQCSLHFALAKVYDDIGERDRGFDHLLQGNALKRAKSDYDEAGELALMDRIQNVFTAELLATRGGAGDPSTLPVFIVGMPRSGTTLVEQILASHPSVYGAGERMELPREVGLIRGQLGTLRFPDSMWLATGEGLRATGASYLTALRDLAPPDVLRITDKLPLNFRLAGLIHLVLPHARIIHLNRDPVDTCLSCFSKLFAGDLPFTYDLAELGRYHRGYQRLMAHWRAVLPKHVLLDVHYEQLVQDFAGEARRIVAHSGLPWDKACQEFYKTSRPVQTASITQVRQPIYRSSVGRWRPDAALLRPLIQALQPGDGASPDHG